MLRTKDLENMDFDPEDPWTDILASVMWAVNSSFQSIKQARPGQLVFGRDMIFHDTFKANWHAIHTRKARITLDNTSRENRTRSHHIYKVGDYAFITAGKLQRK